MVAVFQFRLPVLSPVRVIALLILLGCSALIAWASLYPAGRVFVHWLAGPLLPGASPWVTTLYVAGAGFAAFCVLVCEPRFGTVLPPRVLAIVFVASLAAGHATVATTQFIDAFDGHALTAQRLCHASGTDLWCDDIAHNGAGAALLSGAAKSRPPGATTLLPPHPAPTFVTGLALVLGVIAALALLPEMIRRHAGRWRLLWPYILASLHCLTALADGGPLSARFPIGLGVLLVLLVARDASDVIRRVRAAGPWLLAALVAGPVFDRIGAGEGGVIAAAAAAGMLAIGFLAPLAVAWRPVKAARRRLRSAAVGAVVTVASGVYAYEAAVGVGSLLQPLPPGYRYTVLDLRNATVHHAAAVPQGMTAVEVYARHGDDPLAPTHVFLWRDTGEPQGALTVVVARRGTDLPIVRAPPGAPARILGALPDSDPRRDVLAIRGEEGAVPPFHSEEDALLSRHNAAVHLRLAGAMLQARGVRDFTLVPLAMAEELPPELPSVVEKVADGPAADTPAPSSRL